MSGSDPTARPPNARIRLLLVDDSPLALLLLKRMLDGNPDVEIIGTARNGKEALELIPSLRPQVICTDLEMPGMDGLELTRQVMARYPTPILVFSAHVGKESGRAYPVLEAGALDLIPKPGSNNPAELARVAGELTSRVKVLAGVHVFARNRRLSTASEVPAPAAAPPVVSTRTPGPRRARGVVIGASTGGPLVLKTILETLPAGFGVPVLCVQHISEGFLAGLIDWLSPYCRLRLGISRGGELPEPGTVWFPREGSHLEIDSRGRLFASSLPAVDGHRPSITTTMLAAARCWGGDAVGVLLTGMGSDGSAGLAEIAARGGLTIAQTETTCAVYGMPKHAIERGAARYVLSPGEIGSALARLQGTGN